MRDSHFTPRRQFWGPLRWRLRQGPRLHRRKSERARMDGDGRMSYMVKNTPHCFYRIARRRGPILMEVVEPGHTVGRVMNLLA